MTDTSAAREEIREAYECHRAVMGGMSMAMLKLEAAAGLMRPDPRLDDPPLPYPEDSPIWLEHAEAGLARAYEACEKLREAITSAQAEVTILHDAIPAPSGDTREGRLTMAGIPCKCGRFLAKPHAISDSEGEGYTWHMFLADVRGDCKRCGPDVQAMRGDGWWWSWDAWKWPAELESL